jgi:hypothetical protein
MIEKYDLSFLNLNSIRNTLLQINTATHGLVSKGSSTYNYGMPTLQYSEFFGLNKIIQRYVELYSQKYKIPKLKIINSWFNISEPGSKLKPHNHGESIISGAFYISGSVPLIFLEEEVKPYPGLLTIFSSELVHYTEKELEKRIVISFNTDYL